MSEENDLKITIKTLEKILAFTNIRNPERSCVIKTLKFIRKRIEQAGEIEN